MNDKSHEIDPSSRGHQVSGKDPSRRISALRSRSAVTYLVIFLVLMTASVLMYTAANSGSRAGAVILLLLVVLANLLSLVF